MASVTLDNLCKSFGEVPAVNDVTMKIEEGELVTLLGPSGCGKSTTLYCIAGLEEPTSGDIFFDEHCINELSPKDRNIAMVFQDYALYPHMSVFKNLSFSLSLEKIPRKEMEARVNPVAEMLGLSDLLHRRPSELSGGQRQRVAVGRAIVRNPTVFLMDEPLSNLDAALRVRTRTEIKKLQKELEITTIFVTHDQEEAMVLSDRIAVMKDGILQQYSEPEEVYGNPDNLFVAGFIGSPAMNFIDGEIDIEGNMVIFRFTEHNLRLPTDVLRSTPFGQKHGSRKAVLGIRPEHLTLGDSRGDTAIVGDVFLVEPVGSVTYIDLRVGDILLKGITDPDHKPPVGETVPMGFNPGKVRLFDPRTEERL